LGLSISRELANLLGGELQLESEKGKGSTFTIYLPQQLEAPRKTVSPFAKITNEPFREYQVKKESRNLVQDKIPDDRESLKKGNNNILLIIEDDPKFAKLLLNQCREKGYDGLVALTGEEGIELSEKYFPAAVILDLQLPGIDGWAVLDTLKNNPNTRHIPVHIILDLGLPDMTGFQLLKTLEEMKIVIPPVIVYTGKDLTREEESELRNYAESIIIKGVRSEERLMDETSLFLHRMVDKLPEQKRKMIADLHNAEEMFKGKKVLIVDDDMRNVFALS
jgi:CheY-like chemotaxis protein